MFDGQGEGRKSIYKAANDTDAVDQPERRVTSRMQAPEGKGVVWYVLRGEQRREYGLKE